MGLREVIAEVSDSASVMEHVLAETVALVPTANGAAFLLGAEAGYLSCVAAAGQLANAVGTRTPIHGSMTGRCLLQSSLERCADTANDPRVDLAVCRALSIASMICVPLQRRTGTVGVFAVSSDQPGVFGPTDEEILDRLTDFISVVIGTAIDLTLVTEQLLVRRTPGTSSTSTSEDTERGAARQRAGTFIANVMRPGAAIQALTRTRIEQVLAGDGLSMVLQPILALESGWVVGAEALARFEGPPRQGPDCWFADATAVGLGDQLELLAVERALALLPLLPAELGLTVNVGPETLCTRALFERLEASTPGRITVELTEHVAIDISPKVRQARHTLRELGAKVAIDDTGTGFASLSLVLEMAPEVIKLDRALTSGIDFDPVRQALAQSLVGFAAGTGAEVVAEGIETEAELGVLTDMGVPYGQGYYLARPGSVEDLRRLVNRPQDVASLG